MDYNYGYHPISGEIHFLNRRNRVGGLFGQYQEDKCQFIRKEISYIYQTTKETFCVIGSPELLEREFRQIEGCKTHMTLLSSAQFEKRKVNLLAIDTNITESPCIHLRHFLEKVKSVAENYQNIPHVYIYFCESDKYFKDAYAIGWTVTYASKSIRLLSETQYGKALIMITAFMVLFRMEYGSRTRFQSLYEIPEDHIQYIMNNQECQSTGLIRKDTGFSFEPFRK